MIQFKKLEKEKLITDPIHSRIAISYQVILDLINTTEFQRLHFIRQLGATFYVYPTAEHSRFSHSLGTYEIVRRLVENFPEISNKLDESEKVITMIAGLLHDLGHGPLSHAFEMVHDIAHELYSVAIITKPSMVNKVLKDIDPKLPRLVADVIEKKCPRMLMWQLISSQVDCDRMDYLLRDAYFAGLSYGDFDLNRILSMIRVIDDKIVFRPSGISSLENFILGRYHMYQQLYLHPTSLGVEVLYAKWLQRIKELYQKNYPFKNDLSMIFKIFSDKMIELEDYIPLNDNLIFYFIMKCLEEDDEILKDLSDRFINRRLLNHKFFTQEKELLKYKQKYFNDYYYYQMQLKQVIYKRKVSGKEAILIDHEDGICDLWQASEIVKSIIENKKIGRNEYIIFYLEDQNILGK